MATGRAALEVLLRSKQLDVTLTTARPWVEPEDRVAATGLPELDQALGGGLRRGHLSEIVGARSTGRTSVLCRLLAAATARGEVVALVDTCDRFDPESAAAAGLDLARLLWIRDHGDAARALKAVNLVVQAGGFGVVAFDLADVAPAVRHYPYTTWMRLSRVIEGSQTALVLLGSDRIARSAGGVTIALQEAGRGPCGRWAGATDRARYLAGLDIDPRVIKAHAPAARSAHLRAPRYGGEASHPPSRSALRRAGVARSTSHMARSTSHMARRTSHVVRDT